MARRHSRLCGAPPNPSVQGEWEGGGNNIYEAEINRFLDMIVGTPEQDAYIVMDKIAPPVSTNYMVRPLSDGPMLVKPSANWEYSDSALAIRKVNQHKILCPS